jgi:NADH:ubiquinone reductase (H+-translocating)
MKKKIVVIGGGFAGVQFVQNIDQSIFDVLLVDKINHHQFQPLFYQVATAQLEPASISFPLRNIFRGKHNLQIRMTEVLNVQPITNTIQTTIGIYEYDYLIIAIGCKTNFFGNEEISKNAFTLKTTYDAIQIRNHILQLFESLISVSESEKEYLQNLIIVGSGPTGVELAGAFAEIKNNILHKDYPGIDFSEFKIILIEGSKNTLNSMSFLARNTSRIYLEEMGVILMTEIIVKNYDGKTLELTNGDRIKSKTVIWAAGVIGNKVDGIPPPTIVQGNRISVNRMNLIEGTQNIYAIGDIAHMETPLYPKGHPQLANVAINQAKNLANNFKRMSSGLDLKEFEYKDLGTMATVGRYKALVDLPNFKFKGYFAWFIWMLLHLILILNVRNKLIIFINWAWFYLMKDTSLRLILRKTK